MSSLIKKFERWYHKYDRPLSSLSLIGGFVFDALTLRRVDTLWENLWVVVHLVIVAVAILLLNLDEEKRSEGKSMGEGHFWLVNILQFFFGGLLSTYLVFYFRSATLSSTWPFIALLGLAFIVNERLKKHYDRLVFQIGLFYLSVFSFTIFSVPIVLHSIGRGIFILSGLISLVIITIFLSSLKRFSKKSFKKEKQPLTFVIGTLFLVVNALYFTNLIPPLPLALKDGGVYHSLERNVDGDYVARLEDTGWRGFFNLYDDFHLTKGAAIYAYSAIFSPSKLNLTVVHEWQHFNEVTKNWETIGTIDLDLVGGREGGFRTYSVNYGLEPGRWRVNVETTGGEVVGRLRFNIVPTEIEPTLSTTLKQ